MTFHQFLTILLARKRIALSVLALTVLATLFVSLVMPESYKATTKLVINYKATDPVSGVTSPDQLMPGYMATQADIISSRNVALKVVDNLGLTSNPIEIEAFNDGAGSDGDRREQLADVLSRKITVKPQLTSSTIDVSYESKDPKLAAAVANAFADAYIQTNLQLKTEPAKRTAEWFGDQVKDLRDNLIKAQQRLADYQREKGIVSLDERLDVESARLAELSNQLVLAQAQTFDASSRENQTYSGRRMDQLSSDVSSSRHRESAIRSALAHQKTIVMEINRQREKLGILQGDVATAQRVMDMTMPRFSQVNMEGQANQSEVAVLDRATPPMEPSRPKIFLNLLVSIFLGTMLAVGSALLAEMRDRRIHEPEDLVFGLNLPVLALISATKSRRNF